MPRDDTLWKRLESALPDELHQLAELIGVRDAPRKSQEILVAELSEGIRSAAGHLYANASRGLHDFPYKQILIDVARKLANTGTPCPRYSLEDSHTELEIEEAIWGSYQRRLQEALEKMPEAERNGLREEVERELRNLGYTDQLVAAIGLRLRGGVNQSTSRAAGPALAGYTSALGRVAWKLFRNSTAKFNVAVVLIAVVLLGVTAVLTLLGGTVYLKTVPATLYLIQIRKIREIERDLQ